MVSERSLDVVERCSHILQDVYYKCSNSDNSWLNSVRTFTLPVRMVSEQLLDVFEQCSDILQYAYYQCSNSHKR